MPSASLRRGAGDTPLARWLIELAEQLGWTSGRQAAKYLRVNQAAFATWLRGDYAPGPESQERLAESAGVPVEVVARLASQSRPKTERPETDSDAGGRASLADEVAARVLTGIVPLLPRHPPTPLRLDALAPLVDILLTEDVGDVAAGEEGEDVVGQVGLSERRVWWRVRVDGTCMEPAIRSGDHVIVEPRAHAEVGETVVVLVGDSKLCKRLTMSRGELWLVADDGTEIRPEDAVTIGVVRFVPMPRRVRA